MPNSVLSAHCPLRRPLMVVALAVFPAALALPPVALASQQESLGLVMPVLSTCWGKVLSIHFEGREGTSLVLVGAALLNGDEALATPEGRSGIYVLDQTGPAQWSVSWSSEIEGLAHDPIVTDVDGDEAQELLVASLTESGLERLYTLHQKAGAPGFEDPGAIDLPAQFSVHRMDPFRLQGGLVIVGMGPAVSGLGRNALGYEAMILEPEGGLHLVNTFPLPSDPDNPAMDFQGYLPLEGGGILFALETDYEGKGEGGEVGIPLREDGCGRSFRLPGLTIGSHENFVTIREEDRYRSFYWVSSSLWEFVPTSTADSVTVDSLAIEGLPEGWWANAGYPTQIVQLSDPPILGKLGQLGTTREGVLVEFAGKDPRVITRWAGVPIVEPWTAPMACLIRDPDGQVEVLWNIDGCLVQLPARAWAGPAASVSTRLTSVQAFADLDGDGRKDLLGIRSYPDYRDRVLVRGMGRPPWFEDPLPVAVDTALSMAGAFPGDFDGDGKNEILAALRNLETEQAFLQLYAWDGQGLAPSGALLDAFGEDAVIGDFDGDGKDEAYCPAAQGCRFLTFDRTRQASAIQADPVVGGVWFGGDFDGDGKDELMGERGPILELWRVDARTGTIKPGYSEWAPESPYGGAPVNMDADRADELFWSGPDNAHLWSWDSLDHEAAEVSFSPVLLPCHYWAEALDWEGDGIRDLALASNSGFSFDLMRDPAGSAEEQPYVLADAVAGFQARIRPFWTDVDGDGDPDLIVIRSDGIRVALNDALPSGHAHENGLGVRILSPVPARLPFSAAIRLARPGWLDLGLFDVGGRCLWRTRREIGVTDWVRQEVSPGESRLPSGVYFLRAEASGDFAARPLVILK
jgi:hypothetical protein